MLQAFLYSVCVVVRSGGGQLEIIVLHKILLLLFESKGARLFSLLGGLGSFGAI